MPMVRSIVATATLLLLAACGSKSFEAEPKPLKLRPNDWHTIVSSADRDRLAKWRTAWMAGLDMANGSGSRAQVAAQGVLLKPDAALDDPLLPPGDYRCRVVKLGAQTKGLSDYVAYPFFTCQVRIDEGRLRFTKLGGSQRPVGDIFPDETRRMIFLGAMMLGDEARPLVYGRDAERDMAGIVERVEPGRWRIAFPYPRWESTIDILELVPKD